jgi:SAM-dependent methyltransferase
MDHLDEVLAEIYRCLKPGGSLLCSVVTDRFLTWALLPKLAELSGAERTAKTLRQEATDYHHLVNALTVTEWCAGFEVANFSVEQHIPILPKVNSAAFLLMDGLWHVRRPGGGELGDLIFDVLQANAAFPQGFRTILHGLLDMETDWSDCSGAVFSLRKPL